MSIEVKIKKEMNMRCLIVMLMLFVFIVPVSEAVFVPVELVGNAYDDGPINSSVSLYVGQASKGGTFIGFKASDSYRVTVLRGFVRGVGDWDGLGVDMALVKGAVDYRNSGIIAPNQYNVIYNSDKFTFDLDGNVNTVERRVDVNIDKDEVYWVRYSGYAYGGYVQAAGFELEGEKMAGVHTPEPTTVLLLGGGLLFMLKRRKQLYA